MIPRSGHDAGSAGAAEVLFGIIIAGVYGMLLMTHMVYGLFIALVIVCGLRGMGLWAWAAWQSFRAAQPAPLAPQPQGRRLTPLGCRFTIGILRRLNSRPMPDVFHAPDFAAT